MALAFVGQPERYLFWHLPHFFCPGVCVAVSCLYEATASDACCMLDARSGLQCCIRRIVYYRVTACSSNNQQPSRRHKTFTKDFFPRKLSMWTFSCNLTVLNEFKSSLLHLHCLVFSTIRLWPLGPFQVPLRYPPGWRRHWWRCTVGVILCPHAAVMMAGAGDCSSIVILHTVATLTLLIQAYSQKNM